MPATAPLALEPQSAAAVLMVRPARFGFNLQTAASNRFQQEPGPGSAAATQAAATQAAVLQEFDAVAAALRRAGIAVLPIADTPEPPKPDAIFPNNWVSFHHDGTVALYPMLAANRRWERRDDILTQVVEAGFRVVRTIDLTHRENEGKFLEGTGSLVLDRANRVAYASSSPRTDLDVLGEFAQLLDYDLISFDATDGAARPIYHTNVLMAVGTHFAVLCGEAIDGLERRNAVLSKLRSTGHEVVEISRDQMLHFAGNLLELKTPGGGAIVLSTTALAALQPAQRRRLEHHADLLPVAIPTIERLGGGGVRCMLAEIHLPNLG